jgi:putative transposase
VVGFLVAGGLSAYRACLLVSLAPATFRYQAHPDDDSELIARVDDLATRYPRYGYRRITALIRQTEGVNHKRVRRVWRHRHLQVKRVRRLRPRRSRSARREATHPGQIWAYDFVEDTLASGRPFKVLTVIDACTREGLALDVARTTSAERVIGVLTALFAQHGAPSYLRSDNGAEFVAQAVQRWLRDSGVQTLYIEPGKPWHNGKEERFNGTVRDECLNRFVFGSLAEARVRLNRYRHEYNSERPHSSLGYLTPHAFRAAWVEAQQKQADPLIGT